MSRSEYRNRMGMGLLMALIAAGVLLADGYLAAWFGVRFYPCLFVGMLLLAYLACRELHVLLSGLQAPPFILLLGGVCTIFLANWPAHLGWLRGDPFRHVCYAFVAWVMIGFLYEMAVYRPNSVGLSRLGLFFLALAYLGVLPAFLVQLRFLPGNDMRGAAALGLLIAVPKGGDIAAYFTGRYLGRHTMTPLLSPKKTWEGLFGGFLASAAVAVAIHRAIPGLFQGDAEAALFGLSVGIAGVLGDLAESLIKRDCGAKDASNVVPGFGGILDVVDSVIFAAPVAYWWLTWNG